VSLLSSGVRRTAVTFLVLAACASPAAGQQGRVVRGRVLAAADSTALGGVMVGAVGLGTTTVTDDSGTFTLAAPAGAVRVTVAGAGIRSDTVAVPANTSTVTIYAWSVPIELPGLVVQGSSPARARFDTLAQSGTVTLSGAQIRQAPSLLEPDVIRAVQLLPGTVARNDYSIGYDVHGGEADQNLVQLDGITIFNPSHLGGLFSTFDANAVDHVDFLTGGFPAEYSDRLSSVLDVAIRDGDHTHLHGSGAVSLLSSKLMLEGPVGPISFLVSARRTYVDQIVRLVSSKTLPYSFTDLLGKLDFPYGRSGDLSITGYWGRDVLNPTLVDATANQPAIGLRLDWGNVLLGADWRQPLGSALFEQRLSITTFSSNLALEPNFVHYANPVSLWSSRSALSFAPGGHLDVTLGAQLEQYDLRYTVANAATVGPFSGGGGGRAEGVLGGSSPAFFDTRYQPRVLTAFFDDQWRPSAALLLRGGVRVSRVSGADVTDVSPRASFKVFLSRDQAITGSAGRYYQVVQSLADQNSPIQIYQFWVGANDRIPVASSYQVVLGYDRWFGTATELDVEGYGKTFDDLIRPNITLAQRDTGSVYLPVRGNAWGVDVLLRRHVGRVQGWVAYSYLRAIRRSEGLVYPPPQDRRQTVNIVVDAPGPLHSDMGVRLGYGSPLPYTPLIGTWDHGIYSPTYGGFTSDPHTEPVGGALDSARYPSYWRADLGFRWHHRHGGLRFEPYLDVANVLDHRNVFAYFYETETTPATRTVIYQFPVLVSFGVDFAW
jgi:TonB-dependent Receptor Plug Domain